MKDFPVPDPSAIPIRFNLIKRSGGRCFTRLVERVEEITCEIVEKYDVNVPFIYGIQGDGVSLEWDFPHFGVEVSFQVGSRVEAWAFRSKDSGTSCLSIPIEDDNIAQALADFIRHPSF